MNSLDIEMFINGQILLKEQFVVKLENQLISNLNCKCILFKKSSEIVQKQKCGKYFAVWAPEKRSQK